MHVHQPVGSQKIRAEMALNMEDSTEDRAPTPEGWHTITPRIVVQEARLFVEFLAQIFDAQGQYEEGRPSMVRIGDSLIMVSEAGVRSAMPAFLYVYVNNVEAVYARGLDAGAQTLEAPFDTPYGDRRCMLEDRWGNVWQVATYGQGHRNA